ncbi:hypothetical protein ACMBCN_03075, partial [Candidatus Liberibacter asiaticus]|nr:hypothetical protein [Candidatus Liberibacter asiaticus]
VIMCGNKIEISFQVEDCQKWWLPLLSKKATTDNCKEKEKWNKLAPTGREENGRCNEVIAYLITQIVANFLL